MENIQEQKPFTTNQISNEKPNAPRTSSVLSGYVATTFNGGHNKTIAFKQIMAGERHTVYRFQGNFQMLTPKTPAYQRLKCTIRTYFVPNSRIWTNAEKYTAQKGGTSEEKIAEIPNLGGKIIDKVFNQNGTNSQVISFQSSEVWRDRWIASYLPRQQLPGEREFVNTDEDKMPKVSVLPLRGRIAIYNDFERNKEYDEEMREFKDDTVSQAEWEYYAGASITNLNQQEMRAKRENSYYSDYRTDLQGFEDDQPNGNGDNDLLTWAAWESKIAEARSQAENAQMNDWDIIAKMRGSKVLTEGKVQLIGKKTFALNYAAITQNAYNNNEEIEEQFRVMGKQGAYCYTEVDLPLYEGVEFKEEGYIHIIATVTADTVFESAYDRLELNVTPLDQYRPDMEGQKYDVLYNLEMGSINQNTQTLQVMGFKRKYSEYFKLPNVISGDISSMNYYQWKEKRGGDGGIYYATGQQILNQNTYQFFEITANMTFEAGNFATRTYEYKNPWQDYTDLMINKNQAIKNDIIYLPNNRAFHVCGQNQIIMVGVCNCVADLPIDEAIKENYTKWGEH